MDISEQDRTHLYSKARTVLMALYISCLFTLGACGGGSGSSLSPVINPVPQVATLTPASVRAGAATFTLTVTGSGFVNGSTVMCNGYSRNTAFVSSTQLTATMPAEDIAQVHPLQITVVNPGPGGGVSNAIPVTVLDPLPAVTSLSPPNVLAGGPAFMLTVNGSGFQANSTVQWNGIGRVTTYLSSKQLAAAILAGDLTGAGTSQITVLNPGESGGMSNQVAFNVYNPPPVLTSMDVTSMYAGSALTQVTIRGTGFLSGVTVQWNGNVAPMNPLTLLAGGYTHYIDSTTLQYTTALAFTGQPGPAQITAVNPLSGNVPSNPLTMTLNASGPGLTQTLVSDTGDFVEYYQARPEKVSLGPSAITPDNRYVIFSATPRLDPSLEACFSYTNQVYARDTCTGAGPNCVPATVNLAGPFGGACPYYEKGYVSNDARYAGLTDAWVLFPTYSKVELWDTCINGPHGCTRSAIDISVRPNGTAVTDPASDVADISADGQYVLFWSQDGQIDAMGSPGLFLRDSCIGVLGCLPSTQRVSVDTTGTKIDVWDENTREMDQAHMTPDARFIAFTADPGTGFRAFVRDTCIGAIGACSPSTAEVSVNDAGTDANGTSYAGGISSDGRYVTFASDGTNLVPGDTNGTLDVFVRDTCTGVIGACTPTTVLVSDVGGGVPANGASAQPAIDGAGRYVVFTSLATNLDALSTDTNGASDVFIRDTCAGAVGACMPTTRRLSVNANGAQGNVTSSSPVISRDGRVIVFYSSALNLLLGPARTYWESGGIYLVQSPF